MAKILVVEDSLELLEMLRLLLEMNGHEVRLIWDDSTVHKAIAEFDPNLVILDVWLSNKKSGKELCIEIKKANANFPVLLMSANPELLKDFEDCQADASIEKPFDIKILNDTINSLLVKNA